MSQNFDIGPGFFSVKFRKNIQRKITKSSLAMDVIYKH